MRTARESLFENKKNELLDVDFENNILGRVVTEQKGAYMVMTDSHDILCKISGKFRFQSVSREDLPAVGDWVLINESGE